MFYWFRHLPVSDKDLTKWSRFIKNDFFHRHFMKFVYLLQISIIAIPFVLGSWFSHIPFFYLVMTGIITFIIHECIHILIVYKKGNISLTFQGVFFWLDTDALMSKRRFFLFMSGPFVVLSLIPFFLSLFMEGNVRALFLFISWLNTFISGADIINTFLILQKPKQARFYRGYYID